MPVTFICSSPGCNNPAPCKQHRRDSSARAKPYNNARWRRYRLAFLAAHPLCEVYCRAEGRTTAANTVHHPRGYDRNLGELDPAFWDPTNHQAGCRDCNVRFANEHEGGWGHRRS